MHQELIQETLESMRAYVPKLIDASGKIAEDIQSHQAEWIDLFMMYLDGMGWLNDAVTGIQRLDTEILIGIDGQALVDLLVQMKQALEQEDFVTLCDLLQYEVKPVLQRFEECLVELAH
ncbi:hypothetical protein [Brevibacillus borstelensis]|jgi:hypothetical protein|uniref:hypothetical protein n=1 Tax=Brevibacillus borstelensis TaxID=45462 RepID=UPI002E1D0AEA|nr:hypothetical protein [Brevibacillus borstelensis]